MFTGNILEYNSLFNIQVKTGEGIDLSLNKVNEVKMVFMDKVRIKEIDILENHNKENDVDIVIDIHAVVERSIKFIEVNNTLER